MSEIFGGSRRCMSYELVMFWNSGWEGGRRSRGDKPRFILLMWVLRRRGERRPSGELIKSAKRVQLMGPICLSKTSYTSVPRIKGDQEVQARYESGNLVQVGGLLKRSRCTDPRQDPNDNVRNLDWHLLIAFLTQQQLYAVGLTAGDESTDDTTRYALAAGRSHMGRHLLQLQRRFVSSWIAGFGGNWNRRNHLQRVIAVTSEGIYPLPCTIAK